MATATAPARSTNDTSTEDGGDGGIAQAGEETSGGRKRYRYEKWQREMVKREYPTCDTPEEKLDLCRRAGIKDIRRLYNLACQEGITRRSDDLSDAEFRAYTNGDQNIMSLRRSYTPEDEDSLLRRRDDPRTTKLSLDDEKFLIGNFGRMDIVAIAKQRNLSETAVLYFARHLLAEVRHERVLEDGTREAYVVEEPLRRPAVGFALNRVSRWLGLSEQEVRELTAFGVAIRPLPTRRGEVEGYWVLAKSLAPFLRKHGARLVKEKNADMFFIKEILETEAEIEAGKVTRTGCYFADHGHRCRNPWAGPRYETFCPHGLDPKCKVKELRF
jgi:hypothetical protein